MVELVFTAVVGSRNYGLADHLSDIDRKGFTMPTFDDLYDNHELSSSRDPDFSIHDIRLLPHNLFKSNINFLEVLFSTDMQCDFTKYPEMVELISMRELIASHDLSQLYNATLSMVHGKIDRMHKVLPANQIYHTKYGYSTKDFMQAERLLDFLERYRASDFKDFGSAIRYSANEAEAMLKLKAGSVHSATADAFIRDRVKEVVENCHDDYRDHGYNFDTRDKVDSLIKSMVRRRIMCAI